MKSRRYLFLLLVVPLILASGCRSSNRIVNTGDVVENMSWADHVGLIVGTDQFAISTNGLPDHEYLDQYIGLDLDGVSTFFTYVVESPLDIEITLNPELADQPTYTGLNEVGLMLSGAPLYNPYEGDQVSVAQDDAFEVDGISFFDSCWGHPSPPGSYHYHGRPVCITDIVDRPGQHSHVIGIALDGFPIYGAQGKNGKTPTDLNQCRGHIGPTPEFPGGIFHYHLIDEAPYSLICFSGEIQGYHPPTLADIEAEFEEAQE
ncbi:MAG: hypothetical protein ACI9EW_000005 [Cellvibrionaceae bacterium]|jgi:hypothetical protein